MNPLDKTEALKKFRKLLNILSASHSEEDAWEIIQAIPKLMEGVPVCDKCDSTMHVNFDDNFNRFWYCPKCPREGITLGGSIT